MTTLPSIFLIFLLLLTNASAYSPSAPAPSPVSDEGNTTDFIRMSCESTLYPDLCYDSLSSYANSIQQDSSRLARTSIGVCLNHTKNLTIYIAKITSQTEYGTDPRAASAIHDCFSVFKDAVSQIKNSLTQMRQLTGDGEELRFQMSNVQTWMSAALSNEETCTDGFKDVNDGPMKVDVCDRTARVKEVTSNALALVNSFAAKVIVP